MQNATCSWTLRLSDTSTNSWSIATGLLHTNYTLVMFFYASHILIFLYTHTQTKPAYLSILVVTDKSSTWKHVNILMIGSHSKSSNMDFDQKNMTNTIIESILKKKKKNTHTHTPSVATSKLSTALRFFPSYCGASVEQQWVTQCQIHQYFHPIWSFFRWLHWAEEKSFVRM